MRACPQGRPARLQSKPDLIPSRTFHEDVHAVYSDSVLANGGIEIPGVATLEELPFHLNDGVHRFRRHPGVDDAVSTCGNAAYLRRKYGAEMTMHHDDAGMVERGDMFWNGKSPNPFIRLLFGPLLGPSRSDRFEPDVHVEDGYDVSPYWLDAAVLHLPGHSRGQ